MFKCSQCDKEFVKQNKLTRHFQSLHDEKRPFVCDDPSGCTESFKRKDHLLRHRTSKHASEEERMTYACPYSAPPDGCLMRFPNRDQ